MNDVFARIGSTGVLPVVVMDDAARAVPLARSLAKGGIPLVEFTFRTPSAADAIAAVSREMPEVLVGAGTVLSVGQARTAIRAGARFIVSPGLDPAIVRFCLGRRVAVIPGVATPSEIQSALRLGVNVLKFFPSESLGGLKTLKSMAAPFSGLRFVPTGGISLKNLAEYLADPLILACGGTWLAGEKALASMDWKSIELTAAETVKLAEQSRPKA